MEKITWRQIVPYSGIPFLAIALILVRWFDLDGFILLQRELLLVIGYLIAIEDKRNKSIPNSIILTLFVCWLLTIFPQLVVNVEVGLDRLINSLIGFLMGGGLFLLVYLISKKGLGGGDVKLMAVVGLYLGMNGVLPAMLYGSILASAFGLILIFFKKIDRKDAIPLAPFLYIGILIAIFFF